MKNTLPLSRRQFLAQSALLAGGAATFTTCALADSPETFSPPLALFSKVYQELNLDFEQAAEVTAAAGLDGVDCPVRPGGEIRPERAAEDLPRYAEALRKRKVDLLLLTTGILGPATPHAQEILRAARKLGVRFYRLNWVQVPKDADASKQMDEIKGRLKDLAALNRELGLTAVLQNHSSRGSSRYLGGNLDELYELVKDFDPDQIGVAFDLGHAMITHGPLWPFAVRAAPAPSPGGLRERHGPERPLCALRAGRIQPHRLVRAAQAPGLPRAPLGPHRV